MTIKTCPHCNGTGIEPFMPNNSAEVVPCSVCHGDKLLYYYDGELVVPQTPVLNDEDKKLIRQIVREELQNFKEELIKEVKKESEKK